jgi:hypothetical protein
MNLIELQRAHPEVESAQRDVPRSSPPSARGVRVTPGNPQERSRVEGLRPSSCMRRRVGDPRCATDDQVRQAGE